MAKQDPWFFQERAEAFAKLVLTKHNNVKVLPYAGHDMAINLLVEVLKDGKSTFRFFGVQLVPHLDLPDMQTGKGGVFSHSRERGSFEASFPSCVFVIGVRKPEGIYRWVVEPVVEDGRALLQRDLEGNWQTLHEAGVAPLIGQVNVWYDALNGGATPKRRGRWGSVEPAAPREEVMHNTGIQVGDRVKYLGPIGTEAPASHGGEPPDVLLAPGMTGEVVNVYIEKKHPVPGETPVCRVRFDNGFERTLFMDNLDRFERLP